MPALRLGAARVLALLQALCQVAPRPNGFRHRELRPLVAGLSRIYARLLQPRWDALLAPVPDLPEPLREAFVRLDAALVQLRPVPLYTTRGGSLNLTRRSTRRAR